MTAAKRRSAKVSVALSCARLTLSSLALASCSSHRHSLPYAHLASGSYSLQSFNGHEVPVDMGVVGPKGRQTGRCRMILVAGGLTLDTTLHSFSYFYDVRDCNGRQVGRETVSGSFEQNGSRLTFRVPGADRSPSFSGKVERRGIVLTYNDQLRFERTSKEGMTVNPRVPGSPPPNTSGPSGH
jgi:hypothetical protein